ncbi:MAG: hypothetical protein V2A73_22730 [Pseudomonadota bacterium]
MRHPSDERRHVRNYLINARYQLRFTLVLVAICAILMSGLGYWVLVESQSATRLGIRQVRANQAYLVHPKLEEEYLASRQRLLTVILLVLGSSITVGLFAFGIKMTHRVAGPLYRVALYCDKVRIGRFERMSGLRRNDQLVRFYEHFREAHDALRKRQEVDVAVLREAVGTAEKAGLAEKSAAGAMSLEDMKALIKAKEESLG